jgi:type II secretory pathway pseudopilin PulG
MAALRRGSCSTGFSLLELLVTALLASLVLGSLVRFASTQVRVFHHINEVFTANQVLRLVLDAMARDLRQAGFDNRGSAIAPIAVANPIALTLQHDGDGDGTVNSRSDELIRYVFRPATGTLNRIVGRQSMPLATNLSAHRFRLSYFDAGGIALDAGGADLDATALAAIRRVRIAVLITDASGKPLSSATTDVAIRNQPWTS